MTELTEVEKRLVRDAIHQLGHLPWSVLEDIIRVREQAAWLAGFSNCAGVDDRVLGLGTYRSTS